MFLSSVVWRKHAPGPCSQWQLMRIPKLLLVCPILSFDDKLFFLPLALTGATRLNPRWYILKCCICILCALVIPPRSGLTAKQFAVWEGQGDWRNSVCQNSITLTWTLVISTVTAHICKFSYSQLKSIYQMQTTYFDRSCSGLQDVQND